MEIFRFGRGLRIIYFLGLDQISAVFHFELRDSLSGPDRRQGKISARGHLTGKLFILCASAAETRFSVTAESKAMLYIPLQRNTM